MHHDRDLAGTGTAPIGVDRDLAIDASREIGEIAIAISLISMIAIDVDRRSSGPGEIAIVVRRCGWFRRSEGLTEQ